MKFSIVFDNYKANENLESFWGFSCLIEDYFLFDTGSNGRALVRNMAKMGFDLNALKYLFISHPHWDHICGIDSIIELNPNITVTVVNEIMHSDNLASLIQDVDIVLDGTDNFESRFEINKACVEYHKPLISAAVIRFEGQISVFKGYEVDQPCYQCLYSEQGDGRESCVENGVLAPVAGLVGTIQALQAIKVLLGLGEQLCGELLLIDGLDLSFRKVKIVKDSECPICGLN